MTQPRAIDSRLGQYALWVGGAAGLAIWIATMARYPRVSDGPHESNGSIALFPLLALTALLVGYVEPRRKRLVALCVIAAPIILSPFTTPRGDEDGLWVLIIPMLAAFAFVLQWCAGVGGKVRHFVDGRRGSRPG